MTRLTVHKGGTPVWTGVMRNEEEKQPATFETIRREEKE